MKISIITVLYNANKTIESCIKSVQEQTYNDIEYIVIDGNSNDGSIEIINRYHNIISHFVSEKDNGIYDAYNKALNLLTGDWVLFLNADDKLYHKNIINIVAKKINVSNCSLYYGDIIYDDGKEFKSSFTKKLLWKNTLHHQSAFYNSNLFNNRRYNLNNRVLSDYLFHLEIFTEGIISEYINETISICGSDGITKQFKFSHYLEEMKMKYLFFNKIKYLFVFIFPLLKYTLRKFKIYR